MAIHSLTMTFKETLDGEAQFLVTFFVRSIGATVRCYEVARQRLVKAGEDESVVGFLDGCSDLEALR